MKLLLKREKSTEHSTPGTLYVDGTVECFTLEDAVREVPGVPVESWKIPGETAIPAGTYRVVIDFSVRFQREMPHVLDVPGFAGIRIHSGNVAADTEGCILVGQVRQGLDFVARSRLAFAALFAKLRAAVVRGEEIDITIEAFLAPAIL